MLPNLPEDPDVSHLLPFVEFGSPRGAGIFRGICSVMAFHILAGLVALFNFGRKIVGSTPRDSGMVVPCMQLFVLMVSGCLRRGYVVSDASSATSIDNYRDTLLGPVVLWLLVWMSSSFYFMLVTTVSHHQEVNWTAAN